MRTLAIDIETYSETDLLKSGVYKYAEDSAFEILLFAYKIDNGPTCIVDLANGEKLPEEIMEDLTDHDTLKVAYNANFEITCLESYFNITLPRYQWNCTMAKASQLALPLSLDACAKALQLDVEKDAAGKALIKYFSLPCKPTKINGGRSRNLSHHDKEKWEKFKAYCIKDVEVEYAIRKKISWFQVPKQEQEMWILDQQINSSGVLVDPVLVDNAIRISETYIQQLTEEAYELTGLENPNSAAQLKQWLSEETDSQVESLTKNAIPELLATVECDTVKRVLNIRQEMAKTSVKKYYAMRAAMCSDNRVKGLLQYYGASRTGRWAGRLVQVQNLPQNHLSSLDIARDLVLQGDLDTLDILYGNIPDTLSQLIRTAFVAPDGYRFIVADFSAIEARVIAWLAQEKWRLDVFNTHGKIYEASAAQMFKVPIESVTKGSDLRQKGKVAELACIAAGQLVLTDQGLVPIENISINHLVWDGTQFVSHQGLIPKGFKSVITYDGLTATPDHLVWIEGQKEPVQFQHAATSGARLLRSANGRKAIRLGENHFTGKAMEKRLERSASTNAMRFVRSRSVVSLLQSYSRKIQRLPELFKTSEDPKMVGQTFNIRKAAMYQSQRSQLSQLRRARNRVQILIGAGSWFMDQRQHRNPYQRSGIGSNQQRWALRARKPKICFQGNEPSQQAFLETFDILNAGPNNRFTVSGVLVHNCGYQGGPNALINMGALKMGIAEEELPKIIRQWRNANKKIVQFWDDVNDAAIEAVSNPGSIIKLKLGISFFMERGILFIQLPSGRRLSYLNAKIKEGKFGPVVTYHGMNQTTKQWSVQETYGGKLVENIVQAVARDCLATAMLNLWNDGYEIAFHVHDEVVLQMPVDEGSLEEVNKIMGRPIPWAPGLPLTADSYETFYYKKD